METLLLLGLGWLIIYTAKCWWWPFVRCSRRDCEGGKLRSSNRRAWRRCPRCGGSGSRVRLGRRVLELLGAPGVER